MNQTQQPTTAPAKRPSRWSLRNWPVRGKVFAIVAVPLVLALVFAGTRLWNEFNSERDLQVAADRVEMIPVIESYVSAVEGVLLAYSSGEDTQGKANTFDKAKATLQNKLNSTDVAPDVRTGVANLLTGGQQLIGAVSANAIGLRERIATYAPILLTAEDAINGSVRLDDEKLRAQTLGLSRAVGARGQMLMQQMLVKQGGDVAEPELRTSMITLAGTEPSTLFGMSQVLGVGSQDAKTLQSEMVKRMGLISNPDVALVGNTELLQSLQATDTIAGQVITSTTAQTIAAVQQQASDRRTAVIRDSLLVSAAFIIALLVVFLVARSLVRPLRILRDGALRVAHTDLEQGIARVRAGDEREPEPLAVYTTEEIGQVAHAVDELHAQALLLAGDEARLRLVINEMFETMSRRNRSLVDQQLALIDRLEKSEQDPERLDNLFRLDHLATRMRRIGANLLVLAGAQVSRDHRESLPLASAVNAAVSEVEDYKRVEIGEVPDSALIGKISADAVHMLAELIDNALRYSPPISPVRVSAEQTRNAGLLIEVHDDGIGMTDSDLRIANMRLHGGGEVSQDNTRHMGLFVVGRLAHMHGMGVRLRNAVEGETSSGTTAELYIPPKLLEHGSPISTDARRYDDASAEAPSAAPAEDSALPQRSPGSSGITGVPAPEPEDTDTDFIYQKMLNEIMVDPHTLVVPQDWKSVWDNGWETAAKVENVPVQAHTEHGLPVRDPGARLVPGAAEVVEAPPGPELPRRDPDAVRASFSSHFGGVRAARSDLQDGSAANRREDQ
ncbi:sensor histidine kinase [Mycolicibacterium sarraceniae]|uniref:histidine kinase n=1 Tax=Mycolicibacterium sarraceniae TaxID=1534348 RepID=A0A7I7SLY4_9MYCO|nr:sensor histidine kinase [Mycolicibacterium sarraceniae]BBY57411.1 hypothetical protein MSAR_05470 [Mycolicibacterium sarraceniae]